MEKLICRHNRDQLFSAFFLVPAVVFFSFWILNQAVTCNFVSYMSSLCFDLDKKNQQKRKRLTHHTGSMMAEGSPEHTSLGSPRGAGGATVSRLSVPYSERQQMALLMRMQDESSLGGKSLDHVLQGKLIL